MKFGIKHQESYSRGLLLLRSFFGWLYIGVPHMFLLMFIGLWCAILQFLAFWVILFTGNYPEAWFNYVVKTARWSLRVYAALYNLTDSNPAFGLDAASDAVTLDVERPASIDRVSVLIRAFFGWLYVGIPHGFCLYFRAIGTAFVALAAWFVVLFTGKYPEKMHAFVTGTFRWAIRIGLYLSFMTDQYPPFSGKE